MGAENPNELTVLEYIETTLNAGIAASAGVVTSWGDYIESELTDSELMDLYLSRSIVLLDPDDDHSVETENSSELDAEVSRPIIIPEIDESVSDETSMTGRIISGTINFKITIMVGKDRKTFKQWKKELVFIRNCVLNLFLATGKRFDYLRTSFTDYAEELERLNFAAAVLEIETTINKYDYDIN
ncbi:MAG: hypothetical protein WC389_16300 [Lutibacter sp.]|jgi:hypothetical protein